MPEINPACKACISPKPDLIITIITINSNEENNAKCDNVNPNAPFKALSNLPLYYKLSTK